MDAICLIILFLLGTEWGSFFTLIGERIPKEEKFLRGKSYCDSCHHKLIIIDKIPIISYLLLQGRCRYCGAKIPPLSTYMEFFTGILFALSFYIFGFSWEFLIAIGIVAMLIIIACTDITYFIIPDGLLLFFSIYFFIIQLFRLGIRGTIIQLTYGIILFILMYVIMLIGNKIFKRESIGGGDIKMMFVIGLVLDPLLGVISIFLASFLALPISLIALKVKRESIIPFGPFLLVAFMFLYFTQISTPMIINFFKLIY